MVVPHPLPKSKKQKRWDKKQAERGPVLGNFDARPTIMTSLRPAIRGKMIKQKLSFGEKKVLRKRKRDQQRNVRKVLRKKVKRPIFVLPDVTDEIDEEEEKAKKTPPMHFKVNAKKKCLEVKVTLHHCPIQYINLDPTTTHFVLDTLKWTRKYQVKMPYIDKIKCDPAGATAKFEHGILEVTLPITHFPKQAKTKQARISAAIREAKCLRFVQARGGEVVGMRTVVLKERKRKRGGDDDGDDDKYVPIPRVASKKKFITDPRALVAIADDAATAEENKVASRQVQMGVTEAYFKERYAKKMETKGKKASIADKVLERVMKQQQERQKARDLKRELLEKPVLAAGVDAKSGGKRVSFATTNLVVKFGGEGSCAGKKKRGKRGQEDKVVEYNS